MPPATYHDKWDALSLDNKRLVMQRMKNDPNNPYTYEKNGEQDRPWYSVGANRPYNFLLRFLIDAVAEGIITENEKFEAISLLNHYIDTVGGQGGGRRRKSRRHRRRSHRRRRTHRR
jgi:hypothetical protein